MRVVTQVSPARIALRYSLRGRGGRSGEAVVSETDGLENRVTARFDSSRFAGEKAMLTQWFRQQFAGRTRR